MPDYSVGGDYSVVFDRLHAQFPYVKKPQVAFTDFLGERNQVQQTFVDQATGATRLAAMGLEIDPIVHGVYTSRIYVPHHNHIGTPTGTCLPAGYNGLPTAADGLPILPWNVSVAGSVVPVVVNQQPIAPMNVDWLEFVADNLNQTNPGSSHAYTDTNVCCQGFTALFKHYTGSHAFYADETWTPFVSIRWKIASVEGLHPRLYALSFQAGRAIKFAYSDDDGTTWFTVGEMKAGSGRDKTLGQLNGDSTRTIRPPVPAMGVPLPPNELARVLAEARSLTPLIFEVRFLGGKMQIWIGNNDVPYVFPDMREDNQKRPYWMISKLECHAFGFDYFAHNISPSKWLTEGAYCSNEQNVGFVPETDPRFLVHYAPTIERGPMRSNTEIGFAPTYCTGTASVHEINGTQFTYLLELKNNPAFPEGVFRGDAWTDFTCVVRAVTAFFDPVFLDKPSAPFAAQPEEIVVDYTFSLEELSITSAAAMTFDNYSGFWSSGIDGGFVENNGQLAVDIQMGIQGFPLIRRFKGIANTSFTEDWDGGDDNHVTIRAKDSWLPLMDPKWNLPWFDGWNIYYVIFYLAQMGGVRPDRMQFYLDGFVPDQPYGECPNGAQAFFMPVGPAGTPLTRFTGGQKPAEIMRKLSYLLGFINFFDVNTILQFYEFIPQSPGPFKQIFTHVPGPIGEALTEIWNGGYEGSMEEVRNQVTVVGTNAFGPIYNPVVSHYSDEASIEDDTAFNFLGYPSSVVWADSIFANPAFAKRAAKSVINFLRLPGRSVRLTTWMQPDRAIYPMDIIQVSYPKSAVSYLNKRYLVLSARDRQARGAAPQTSLRCKWLPPIPVDDPLDPVTEGSPSAFATASANVTL